MHFTKIRKPVEILSKWLKQISINLENICIDLKQTQTLFVALWMLLRKFVRLWHYWYTSSVIIGTIIPPNFDHSQSISCSSYPIYSMICKCNRKEWHLVEFSVGGSLSGLIVVLEVAVIDRFWDVVDCQENHRVLLFKKL